MFIAITLSLFTILLQLRLVFNNIPENGLSLVYDSRPWEESLLFVLCAPRPAFQTDDVQPGPG